ncbi:MAG TPA: twin-arginine translocation signal domain-containing protein [Gemmatimonadaceae bacterium]
MDTSRRDFLGRVTAGAAAYSALPIALAMTSCTAEGRTQPAGEFDLSWTSRLTGKHKAVFDCADVESGYGVWRAFAYAGQYQQFMGAAPADLSTVVILRHNAIALAMNQAFWDKYGIGKARSVTHPLTLQPTDRNPALLSGEADGVPAPFDQAALPRQMERGVIALACNLALDDCVQMVATKDGVSPDEARNVAIAHMVPGVILQPSGVFAAVRCQEAGCSYVKSS